MAVFDDLSVYRYFGKGDDPTVLHVGWLGTERPYETCSDLPPAFLAALDSLPKAMQTRGWHSCPFGCKVASACEVRVTHDGVTYAAPFMLAHYVREHHYCPPRVFVDAVIAWARVGVAVREGDDESRARSDGSRA